MPAILSKVMVANEITTPPSALQINPHIVIPPFVPAGTLRHGLVTRTGSCFESIPSSDAKVSPKHVE